MAVVNIVKIGFFIGVGGSGGEECFNGKAPAVWCNY